MSKPERTYSASPFVESPYVVLKIALDRPVLVRDESCASGERAAFGISQIWRAYALREWQYIIRAFADMEKLIINEYTDEQA